MGKQELDPGILRRAAILLVDSQAQCERLGELQHAPDQFDRVFEVGDFLQEPRSVASDALTVADFTGLGVEDLYVAEYCYSKSVSADAN